MEMTKVPEAGYRIEGLWISGIQRRLTLDNLAFPLKLISSLRKADEILRRFKPHAAVGVGGFASGPLLRRASKNGIPCLIQEQNSYAGLTNKLLAKRVQKICVAYEGMENFFSKDKIVVTGNPVRSDIIQSQKSREQAFGFFGLDPKKRTLFIMGGSLGARSINNSILQNLQKLIDEDIQLIWQTGKLYYHEVTDKLRSFSTEGIRHFEFLKEMDLAYAAADIVISRAGALSISELCLVKKAVIFVPSPNVAEDHQTKNAETLVRNNAAIMVKDIDASENLVEEAISLFKDKGKMAFLATNISKMAKPEATKSIVHEIIKLVN
jgi:UDP-N-acetylglucosamine--N-acetylmuramyl-(pentapeptide) pyrophosphoryl-undecaprenol N-acetylglucosamine transferase